MNESIQHPFECYIIRFVNINIYLFYNYFDKYNNIKRIIFQ